ncbi:phosphatidylinositol N-acetylglucosaminyltransferase subunit Q-like [Penaeus chinensis]|uniref:phosphatidylinositol N-acetylglucosaminyltransferase subunit Q-like n=1 Tax=Penaeus chinensis TaxID=139456 RepID=UPI001FB847BF|nr:phosphatidylinositol N-acetylglucosaminyltransferase subunit Q-like [Penaeus chinensis]XP_047476602.1 phosphatidylinositol N-acetylglucosaminyltransferase subunit Q-like [Penaeus chinensis]XP_047476603.1 phosphatidylinositol N-acetylglucosaminyltransferase subunit Q-like [Penaeus chinensis]
MLGNAIVTVLVPEQLEGENGGHLYGRFTNSKAHPIDERESYVIVVTSVSSNKKPPIGCINNDSRIQTRRSTRNVWVELSTHPQIQLHSVRVCSDNVCLSEVNLVTYSYKEICESELISRKFLYREGDDHANNIVPYFVKSVQKDCKKTDSCWLVKILLASLLVLTKTILCVTRLPKVLLEGLHYVLVNKFDYSSNLLKQTLLRIKQFETLEHELKENKRTLVAGRLLAMIAIDTLLGVSVALLVSSYASLNDIYSIFCSSTKLLASNVQHLLEWLRGAPAGLKLNQPLTQALSAFFSYHVHLWRLYLDLADPVLRSLASVFFWLGMCGASVQVAILSDLMDLATLHLYCFYVYAARMHMLQISLLGSQWRAFRGRKWNPLKQRVDSYEIEGGHMSLIRVLTAVIFTLVIFLLPTTTVYYLVFVSLRIGLNTVRGILSLTMWVLNINPVYLILLNLMDSNRMKGDIYFATQPIDNSRARYPIASPLALHLHTWPTPLCEVLLYAHSDVFPAIPSPNWKAFFCSVVFAKELL